MNNMLPMMSLSFDYYLVMLYQQFTALYTIIIFVGLISSNVVDNKVIQFKIHVSD